MIIMEILQCEEGIVGHFGKSNFVVRIATSILRATALLYRLMNWFSAVYCFFAETRFRLSLQITEVMCLTQDCFADASRSDAVLAKIEEKI